MNPVDSWRDAKVRGFLQEPRPVGNFFFDRPACPTPFVLGVQKYGDLPRKQAGNKKELVLMRLLVVYKEVVF